MKQLDPFKPLTEDKQTSIKINVSSCTSPYLLDLFTCSIPFLKVVQVFKVVVKQLSLLYVI